LLAAEDRGMPHGKLIEAGRSSPEDRLDEGQGSAEVS
jgi:hypothetical protein